MKKILLPIVLGVFLIGITIIPDAFAEYVPEWVKNTAGWWATNQIDDSSFLQGIQYLIKEGIMVIPPTETSESSGSQEVPVWIKNNAGWWADDKISEVEFVNVITYLIKVGIIIITSQAENVLTDIKLKSSESILDTTSFFEVEVDHIPIYHYYPEWWASFFDCERFFICITKLSNQYQQFYNINSEGFRGPEFIKNKPDNTYRIIAVGGSTTYGSGVTNENTWPRILEKKLQNLSEGTNTEVINAGIGAASSFNQSKLIKEKLIHYKPDLIIIYVGNNDVSCALPEHITKYHNDSKEVRIKLCGTYSPDNYDKIYAERWSEICELGKENGFETVFILQPIPHFNKILTTKELDSYFQRQEHTAYLGSLESFAQQLSNIERHCTKAADFSGIFDYHLEPIYFDYVNVGDRGNEILAGKILELISPILHEKGITKQIPVQSNIIKPSQDPEVILQLYEANWGKLLPNQKIFVGQNLSGKDFSNSNLENTIFFGSDLRNANFENSVLSRSDFSLTNLENANFKNAVIDGIKLRQAILDQTDFSNVDFREVNLVNVDLTNTILKNSNLSYKDLTKTFLYKSDLSGADLTHSNLSVVYLGDTILKDANLTNALLYEADLSFALDKDLSGTVLIGADLTWSNLVGVDFSGKDLTGVNFSSSDLTGQDFRNNVIFFNNNFQSTELSNANFEGADMFFDNMFSTTFKNKAHLKYSSHIDILQNLFGPDNFDVILIASVEVSGNDLVVNYVYYTNFAHANLENANFKNADLKTADFYRANLTNADLSGADLRKSFLGEADLSNANLEGANLQGVILDNAILTGANLKCINHQICESG